MISSHHCLRRRISAAGATLMSPKILDTTNGVSPPPKVTQSSHRPPAVYLTGSSHKERLNRYSKLDMARLQHARTHDYNLFKSLLDSLTDLAQSRLLGFTRNKKHLLDKKTKTRSPTRKIQPPPSTLGCIPNAYEGGPISGGGHTHI
jgi:hypothetical protein